MTQQTTIRCSACDAPTRLINVPGNHDRPAVSIRQCMRCGRQEGQTIASQPLRQTRPAEVKLVR